MNDRWIKALADHTKAHDQLYGDSSSPLTAKAMQNQTLGSMLISSSSASESAFFPLHKPPSPPSQSSGINPMSAIHDIDEMPPSPPSWLCRVPQQAAQTHKKEMKNKKKKEKKKKKRLAMDILTTSLLEVNHKTGNILAEIAKSSDELIIVDGALLKYNESIGCFKPYSHTEVAKDVRSSLDYEDQLKITSREYKEGFEQLRISDELVHQSGFFENKPYVNCLNGVVDVCREELLEHSPLYYFQHCIEAEYRPGSQCPQFLEYVDYITAGDKELKDLLQVLLGYIFSHYNNAKKAILLFSPPHTGKSVLCGLIGRILGKDYVTHVDLSMLQRQEYVAALAGKILNIAPDLKNEVLKDVGFFKSLVSHDDLISARSLYSNPTEIKCGTKMLFSSNHLLSFDSSLGTYDIEAVFNRLVYFPFQNPPITDAQDNKHLSDELFEERNAIFTWAMQGLKEYVDNNERFPEAKLSTEIKNQNIARYCPEKIFFQTCFKKTEDDVYESSETIKKAYEIFCMKNDVKKPKNIKKYIEEHERIPRLKKRIDENGNSTSEASLIHVYPGIRLRKKIRKEIPTQEDNYHA